MGRLFRWLLIAPALAPLTTAATCSPAALKLGDNPKGSLTEHDCRMSDAFPKEPAENAYVDLYDLETAQPGTLTIETTSSSFATLVRLYDVRDRRLGGPDKTPRLTLEIAAGKYKLYVTSDGVHTGTYTLFTSFKARPVCADRPLPRDGEVRGDLKDGDCRHLISLKQRGTLIVDLRDAEAELILRRGREEIARDRERIARELDGDYTFTVHPLARAGGAYRLHTTFCPAAQDLSLNSPVESRVSEDCRTIPGALPQTYSLKLSAAALVAIDLQSAGFEPRISLSGPGVSDVEMKPGKPRVLPAGDWSAAVAAPENAAGAYTLTVRSLCPLLEAGTNASLKGEFSAGGCNSGVLVGDRDSAAAVLYDLRNDLDCTFAPALDPAGIAQAALFDLEARPLAAPVLSPGEYLLMVSASDPGARPFHLETTCRRVCLPEPLKLNETVERSLTAKDCHANEIVPSGETSLARAYTLDLAHKATVLFELPGTDPAASLALWKRDGDKPEHLDESRSIRATLEAGSYLVLAKAPVPLSYRLLASVACTAINLQTGQPVAGALSDADCYDGTGSYYRRYRVLPDQPAVLDLTAASKAFVPVVKLLDGNTVLATDTGKSGHPAEVRHVVEAGGDYAVQVNAENPGGSGAFEVTRRLFPIREISPGVKDFPDADCTESSCVHYYRVQLADDAVIRVSPTKEFPFAPVLELLDQDLNTLERAETEIRSKMKPGRYIVRVSTKSRTYGSYLLTAGPAGN